MKLDKAFKKRVSTRFIGALDTINNQIGKYLGIKILMSCLTGILVFIGLTLFGQDFSSCLGSSYLCFQFYS